MAEINVVNRTLFHGDNLAFLRGINSGTVDLIATDPPFNKGKDFHATPDSLAAGARFQDRWTWHDDVHPEWVDRLEDDWPRVMGVINGSRLSYGDDMGAFLCFMGVRLIEMRRVLKPEGSLCLHCDPTASHYLKELLDAIFGRRSFRNEIVWHYKNASRGRKQFAKSHDVIFWYSRSPDAYVFNRDEVLVPYESGMTAWRYKKQGKKPPAGKTPDDVVVMPSLNTMDKERTGYPTQKPLALYELIINAASNPGGWVLDPFAGCATTCVAAERRSRKWIGMDIWDRAHRTVLDRLAAEKLAVPEIAESAGGGGQAQGMLTFGDVRYETDPPERTDDGEEAVPYLRVKLKAPAEPWQRLSRGEITERLAEAQAAPGGVICGGCGRVLEQEFLELDHIKPRSDGGANDITNRILLCSPCNRRKGDKLTLIGLVKENKKKAVAWMQDEQLAARARLRAEAKAAQTKDELA